MEVEADLFSGRRNPSFTLDAEQSAHLAELLRHLGPGGTFSEPPGLGYRGFLIRADATIQGCTAWRAFHGSVSAECGPESRVLADPSRALERWLLFVAQPRLEPGVYNAIHAELGQP